ncbi:hypothetical protein, conserved [Babesia bigemina]|uniref:Maspardin n=1 Tax=Babesia bigemina TaxID=5866 RepID=A0A061D773_BABBI|nr:hypothetical protein, conserved [Babesia bigemina]CDR96566.1 hypothetical protein, conserved [Babesia bigemina]|eukprot:XP_012768752.1 hypothetical protein, conserved [Babesia bigemina]
MNEGDVRSPTVECLSSLKSIQRDYARFKLENPVKRVFDPISELHWTYYEGATVKKPDGSDESLAELPCVVLLHGICGTAGCYFYVIEKLAKAGVRCISAQYPEYYSPDEWIEGLLHFLEYIKLSKPLVFASDLGGYLLQLFVEKYPESLSAIALCNSYRRTDCFSSSPELRGMYGRLFTVLPHVVLKNIFVEYYICPQDNVRARAKSPMVEQLAREFMANELNQLTASDLGGRISLQMSTDYVDDFCSRRMPPSKILIIETNNNNIPDELTEDMLEAYQDAKIAHMRDGGDFPYLTKPEEIVTYLMVHLTNVRALQSAQNITDAPVKSGGCSSLRDLYKFNIPRRSSESSHCSVIPAQPSWESDDATSPSLSDS